MSNDSSKKSLPSHHHEHDSVKKREVVVRVPWGPLPAVAVSLLAFIGAQLVTAFFIAFVVQVFGWPGQWTEGIGGQFVFVVLSDALILSIIWFFLRRRRGNFRQLGLGRAPAWRDAAYAVLGYLGYFAMFILVMMLLAAITGINLDQKQELGFDKLFDTPAKLMGLVSLVLLPPIVEEIVFRGFMYTGLRQRFSFGWATLITSVLFAAPHLLASSHGLLWVAGADTFVLSLVLCYLREKSGALWAPMAVHAIKNGLAFLLLVTGVVAVTL